MSKVAIRKWNYYLELSKIKSILVTVIASNVMLIDLNIETVYSVVFISARPKRLPQAGKQWVTDNKTTDIWHFVVVNVVEQII